MFQTPFSAGFNWQVHIGDGIVRWRISMVSCQKSSTRHAYALQIGPFWQDTLDICVSIYVLPGFIDTGIKSCHTWNVVAEVTLYMAHEVLFDWELWHDVVNHINKTFVYVNMRHENNERVCLRHYSRQQR